MTKNIFLGYGNIVKECVIALLPLICIMLVYQIFFAKSSVKKMLKMLKGIVIAFFGLTLLLHGVKMGYMPYGREIGISLTKLAYNWIIVPIGFLFGFSVTMAEPSVKVLIDEIEKVTGGYIRKKIILRTLCIGVGLATSLAMIKILYNISLWYFILPGYIICLILTFFVSERFTAIAFDSGGVATGTMATTFILSMAIGVAEVVEGIAIATSGFGILALIALIPILMVLVLGITYERENKIRLNKEKINNGGKPKKGGQNGQKV